MEINVVDLFQEVNTVNSAISTLDRKSAIIGEMLDNHEQRINLLMKQLELMSQRLDNVEATVERLVSITTTIVDMLNKSVSD